MSCIAALFVTVEYFQATLSNAISWMVLKHLVGLASNNWQAISLTVMTQFYDAYMRHQTTMMTVTICTETLVMTLINIMVMMSTGIVIISFSKTLLPTKIRSHGQPKLPQCLPWDCMSPSHWTNNVCHNTSEHEQNCCNFADDIFNCIFRKLLYLDSNCTAVCS